MDMVFLALETGFSPAWGGQFLRAVLILSGGYLLLRIASRITGKVFAARLTPQGRMIAQKTVFYAGVSFLLIMTLQQLGFQLTALLGAAGVMGIAIGFASQTSLSNVISGLFLVSEKPMAVGEVVSIGSTTGIVLSIDLLSVKLRTFDNRFVRIPNETILKGELINFTRFPIRRFDINLGVAYKEDIGRVMRILRELADKNPHVLDEPEPLILFTGFGASSLDIMFGVWFHVPEFLALRKTLLQAVKERFDAEGIEIPFPHTSLYTGSVTDPFPIRLVNDQSLAQTQLRPDLQPQSSGSDNEPPSGNR